MTTNERRVLVKCVNVLRDALVRIVDVLLGADPVERVTGQVAIDQVPGEPVAPREGKAVLHELLRNPRDGGAREDADIEDGESEVLPAVAQGDRSNEIAPDVAVGDVQRIEREQKHDDNAERPGGSPAHRREKERFPDREQTEPRVAGGGSHSTNQPPRASDVPLRGSEFNLPARCRASHGARTRFAWIAPRVRGNLPTDPAEPEGQARVVSAARRALRTTLGVCRPRRVQQGLLVVERTACGSPSRSRRRWSRFCRSRVVEIVAPSDGTARAVGHTLRTSLWVMPDESVLAEAQEEARRVNSRARPRRPRSPIHAGLLQRPRPKGDASGPRPTRNES